MVISWPSAQQFIIMGILEKISEIEKEISRTQKNKGMHSRNLSEAAWSEASKGIEIYFVHSSG